MGTTGLSGPTTSNGLLLSESELHPPAASGMSDVSRVVFQVLFGVTGCWTLVICSVIVFVMHYGNHRQTRKSSKLLVSLAFTGIFAGIILIPWEIFGPILPTKHYMASYWMCKVCSYATAVGLAANELSEFLVILDECTSNIRIKIPDVPPNRISFAIFVLWTFSLLYNAHIFITHGYDPYLVKTDLCGPFMGSLEVQAFFVIDTIIFFFAPVILWFILISRVKHHVHHEMSPKSAKYPAAHHSFIVISFMLVAFICCQLPLICVTYYEEFKSDHSVGAGGPEIIIAIAKLLSYTFNWLSPTAAAFTRPDVRHALKHLLSPGSSELSPKRSQSAATSTTTTSMFGKRPTSLPRSISGTSFTESLDRNSTLKSPSGTILTGISSQPSDLSTSRTARFGRGESVVRCRKPSDADALPGSTASVDERTQTVHDIPGFTDGYWSDSAVQKQSPRKSVLYGK